MELREYRASSAERERTTNILRLTPNDGENALDIGARDGHFSILLAERFKAVTALDLKRPTISHPNIRCVQGDAVDMQFNDASFDFVPRYSHSSGASRAVQADAPCGGSPRPPPDRAIPPPLIGNRGRFLRPRAATSVGIRPVPFKALRR